MTQGSIKNQIIALVEQELNEFTSANQLYHYTGFDKLLNILKTNKINLSSSLGTHADDYGVKPFFLATTRMPSVDSGYANPSGIIYRLVLDKDKLTQNFKSKPVDYWQRKDPADKVLATLRPDDRKHRMNKDFEAEDRIYSDKPYLNNVRNYIKEIEILMTPEDVNSEVKKAQVVEVKNEAAKQNIPVSVYTNKADLFKKQNSITNTISASEPAEIYDRSDYSHRSSLQSMFALLFYDEKYLNDYDSFEADFNKFKAANNLPEVDTYKTYDQMRSLAYHNDGVSGLEADLHNTFKGGHDNNIRKSIHFLTSDMKKNGVTNLKQYYNLKVKGLKGKKENVDYSDKVKLYYKSSYEDEPHQEIPKETPLDKLYGMYFNTWKYNGELSNEDGEKYFQLKTNGGTVGDFINYIYNKYTSKKADQIFKNTAGQDNRVIVNGLIPNK